MDRSNGQAVPAVGRAFHDAGKAGSRAPAARKVGRAADRWSGATWTVRVLYLPCPILPSGWALAGVSGIGSRVGQCAVGTVGCVAGPSSRPAWTWQVNALLSCMLTFGSARRAVR